MAKDNPEKEKDNTDENFRHLVRIANTDLKGEKPIGYALRNIKGIDFQFANAICFMTDIDGSTRAGNLDDSQINKLQEVINDPVKAGFPSWMLNRRKDMEDGKDKHLFTTDLMFTKENDIKMMKKVKSYRGIRHMHGKPVRGQRTKANFRKSKGKVTGVKRKPGAKSGRT